MDRPPRIPLPAINTAFGQGSWDRAQPEVEFYFDIVCPYAFFASRLLPPLCERLGARIDYRPILLGGVLKTLAEGAEKEALKAVEKTKASVRAFVEHPFHLVKNIFRHRKVRYRGLAKNGHQLYTLFGLANVVIGARVRATA